MELAPSPVQLKARGAAVAVTPKTHRVLAIVPSSFCYGLQNLTLAFFGNLSPAVEARFLNTRWNDGEFPRRLDELRIPHSATWLGMFSRRLDPRNVKMTLHCLIKLPIAWWDFMRLCQRFRPDVIYLANHHEIILLWPLLLFYRHRVVCHMHDPPPAIPFQRASFAVWRRAVGRFLFISKSVRDRTELLGPLGVKDAVIYNGVKVSPLAWPRQRDERFVRQFGWPADSVIVGITGQMTATKGHEDFLAAARQAATDHRLRFVIGGRPLEPMATRLRELVREYGLEPRVGFADWLPSSQDFFSAVDVLVLASRHDEGFGLVLAEAMERGAVVLATRSGGATEIVEHGGSGLLIEKQAPVQMADCLLRLAADPALRGRLARAARERIEAHFDLARQVARFEEALAHGH
jgi:glycosyltransferase involved in cell wall biosynthesis